MTRADSKFNPFMSQPWVPSYPGVRITLPQDSSTPSDYAATIQTVTDAVASGGVGSDPSFNSVTLTGTQPPAANAAITRAATESLIAASAVGLTPTFTSVTVTTDQVVNPPTAPGALVSKAYVDSQGIGPTPTFQTVTVTDPINSGGQVTTKDYVDATVAASAVGPNPTFGTVTLNGAVSLPTNATTKQYVDTAISAASVGPTPTFASVNLTGPITTATQGATKQYVDTTVAAAAIGPTPTFTSVTLSGAVTAATQGATKQYVDTTVAAAAIGPTPTFTSVTLSGTQPPAANTGALSRGGMNSLLAASSTINAVFNTVRVASVAAPASDELVTRTYVDTATAAVTSTVDGYLYSRTMSTTFPVPLPSWIYGQNLGTTTGEIRITMVPQTGTRIPGQVDWLNALTNPPTLNQRFKIVLYVGTVTSGNYMSFFATAGSRATYNEPGFVGTVQTFVTSPDAGGSTIPFAVPANGTAVVLKVMFDPDIQVINGTGNLTSDALGVLSVAATPSFGTVTITGTPSAVTDATPKSYVDVNLSTWSFSGTAPVHVCNGLQKIALTTTTGTPFVWGLVQTKLPKADGTGYVWHIQGYLGHAYDFVQTQTITFTDTTTSNGIFIQIPVPRPTINNYMIYSSGRTVAIGTSTPPTTGTDITIGRGFNTTVVGDSPNQYGFAAADWFGAQLTQGTLQGKSLFLTGLGFSCWTNSAYF